MKKASSIFTIIGMIVNIYFIKLGFWWFVLLSNVFGILMVRTLESNKKSIAVGILGLLFTSFLGGIFYLCWDPEEKNK